MRERERDFGCQFKVEDIKFTNRKLKKRGHIHSVRLVIMCTSQTSKPNHSSVRMAPPRNMCLIKIKPKTVLLKLGCSIVGPLVTGPSCSIDGPPVTGENLRFHLVV